MDFETIRKGLEGTPDDLRFWKNRPMKDAKGKVVPARVLGIMNRADARAAGIRARRMQGRFLEVPAPRPLLRTRRSR